MVLHKHNLLQELRAVVNLMHECKKLETCHLFIRYVCAKVRLCHPQESVEQTVDSMRKQVFALKQQLHTSEANQRDFVELSQSLQVLVQAHAHTVHIPNEAEKCALLCSKSICLECCFRHFCFMLSSPGLLSFAKKFCQILLYVSELVNTWREV